MLILSLPVSHSGKPVMTPDTMEMVDAIELRVDYLAPFDLAVIQRLRAEINLPVILTLRSQAQGGLFPHDVSAYKTIMWQLAALNPDYLDVENAYLQAIAADLKAEFPTLKIIASHHVIDHTPEDLSSLLQQMQHPAVTHYKIVTQANSIIDALRMLEFLQAQQHYYPLSAFCMGELGECTRILAPIFGGQLHYASADSNFVTAPGQVSVAALREIYNFPALQPGYQIFALLGNPVSHSVGHLFHNMKFQQQQYQAVYVKLRVAPHELALALDYAERLGFLGFSITMPLKEVILPLLDDCDDWSCACGAVNTVLRQGENWFGSNTDGPACIQVLKEQTDIRGKQVVILGAGGAAKAIAYGCIRSGCRVTLLSRHVSKAEAVAKAMGCAAGSLDELAKLVHDGSIILVNTLPDIVWHDPKWLDLVQTSNLSSGSVVLDINYHPAPTTFLSACAQFSNVICVNGMPVFLAQAELQSVGWIK